MFKNLFKKKPADPPPTPKKPHSPGDPRVAALMDAIENERKNDPLIGAKLGGKEVAQKLLAAFKNEKGVHIESILSALGSLAGYACQASLRAEFIQTRGLREHEVFITATDASGRKFYYGNNLNKPLAEDPHSVWSIVAGAAQHLGASKLLNLQEVSEIFKHVTESTGTETFGIPRIADGHKPGDLPINYVKHMWPTLLPTVKQYCKKPEEWPVLYGVAIQEILYMGKGVIDPDLALSIVLECAIPMSKIDFEAL